MDVAPWQWLADNREWVFSGIGVAVLAAVVTWVLRARRPQPTIDAAPLAPEMRAIEADAAAQEGGVAAATGGLAVGRDVHGGIHFGSAESVTIQSAVFVTEAPPDGVDPRYLLWLYLNQVVADTAPLNLSGVDRKAASDSEQTRLELAAVYTALDTVRSVEGEAAKRGRPRDLAPDMAERQRQSALAFASEARYAALLGDPGAGKTTFVSFLALCLAGELLGLESANLQRLGEEWTQGALLPVRVVLRDFAAQPPASGANPLWAYIAQRLGGDMARFAPLLSRHLIEEGGLLILDGLDEVPEAEQRRQRVQAAIQAFKRAFPKVRILLTSRTYAYQRQGWRLPDFTEAVLAPFTPEQIDAFVDRWYAHISNVRGSMGAETAQGRATLLKAAIAATPHLRELAPRPLLLTLMASLHAWRGGSLPGQREELYEESVDLLLDFWEQPKRVLAQDGKPVLQTESAAEWFRTSRERLQQELERLTFEAHRAQATLQGTADIPEGPLVEALRRASGDPDLKPERVVEFIRDRAGLLTNRGEGVYGYPHRTFQEYLAARHLTRTRFPSLLAELVREEPERWREVCLLAGARVARTTPFAAWSLARRLCKSESGAASAPGGADWWAALLAGQLLVETRIYQAADLDEVDRQTLQEVRGWLARLLSESPLPPVDRALAGRALGSLGDLREGVGVKDGLPDIAWTEVIPPGPFVMGNDKSTDSMAFDDEEPQFTCKSIKEPYVISRYPITVAQYRVFVQAGGYENKGFWTEAGWAWRKKQGIAGPSDHGEPYTLDNHPQVGVSWYEAVAFCNWLSERLGRKVALPAEAQWERAARHTDGRRYPWGDGQVAERCNMGDTGIGSMCAVGMFPGGAAECGAVDMSGNVWEWCRTQWWGNYRDYEQEVDDGLEGDAARVVRGGSFNFVDGGVRCAVRHGLFPSSRDRNLGFRLAASP